MTTQIETLDARNLSCPLPIIRTKKALTGMQAGEILEVITTDKGSLNDLRSLCQQTGDELLSSEDKINEFTFTIRKS